MIRSCIYLCSSVLIFALGLLLNLRVHGWARSDAAEWRSSDFSYLESNYPPTLFPLSQHPRDAALVIEETVHYNANDSREWTSMFPAGSDGFVRLGPAGRLFEVSMFRQLRCLGVINRAMAEAPSDERGRRHVHHCMNYVRQMLLCASSVRLEAMKKDETVVPDGEKVDGIGFEHRCRDWSLLRRKVEENFEGWNDSMREEWAGELRHNDRR